MDATTNPLTLPLFNSTHPLFLGQRVARRIMGNERASLLLHGGETE